MLETFTCPPVTDHRLLDSTWPVLVTQVTVATFRIVLDVFCFRVSVTRNMVKTYRRADRILKTARNRAVYNRNLPFYEHLPALISDVNHFSAPKTHGEGLNDAWRCMIVIVSRMSCKQRSPPLAVASQQLRYNQRSIITAVVINGSTWSF